MQNIAMQVVGKLNFQNLSNFDLKSLNLHFPFLINRFVSGTFEISRKFESNKNKSGLLLVELNNIFFMDALYLVMNYSTVYSKSVLYNLCTAKLMFSFLQEPYKRSVNCDRAKLFKSMRFLRRTGNCQKEEN